MSLITGKEVSRQQWTVLPMPDEAILAVEAMAEEEGQPHMTDGMLNFEWRPGVPFKDGEDEDADLNLDDEELVMGDLELIEETQQEEGFQGEEDNHIMDETPAVEQGDVIENAEVYGDITHEIEAQERAMEDAIYEDDETRSVVEADDTEIRSVIEDDENRSVDNTVEDFQEEE